jgi:hypothetical protein
MARTWYPGLNQQGYLNLNGHSYPAPLAGAPAMPPSRSSAERSVTT